MLDREVLLGFPFFCGTHFKASSLFLLLLLLLVCGSHCTHPPDRPGVLVRGRDELEGLQVPELDAPVPGGGGQEELVRVELHVVDGAAVVGELRHQLASAQVPDLEGEEGGGIDRVTTKQAGKHSLSPTMI